jgi:hypothetical protein
MFWGYLSDVPGIFHRAPAKDRSKILIPIPGGGIGEGYRFLGEEIPIPGGGVFDSRGRKYRFLREEIPIPEGGFST